MHWHPQPSWDPLVAPAAKVWPRRVSLSNGWLERSLATEIMGSCCAATIYLTWGDTRRPDGAGFDRPNTDLVSRGGLAFLVAETIGGVTGRRDPYTAIADHAHPVAPVGWDEGIAAPRP